MMVLQGTTNGGTTKMSSLRLPLVALFLRLVCVCYTLAAALPVTTLEVADLNEDSNTGMLNTKSSKLPRVSHRIVKGTSLPRQTIDSLLELPPHAKVYGEDDDFGCTPGDQLIELDVCITPEQAKQFEPLPQEMSDSTSGRQRRKRQAMDAAAFPIWRGAVIPYVFNLSFSTSDRNLVLTAMAEWELVTCVRFRPATAEDIDLVIFRDGSRCSTNIGRVGGPQVLTLAQPCRTKRILIHELGHVLGLIHEHQRHDRDTYVHVLLQNVRNSTQERYQFSKLSLRPLTDGQVEYSYTSIMHYGRNYFAKHPDLTTLQTSDPNFQNIIGRAEVPSPSDAEAINLLYGCEGTFQNRLPDATCDFLLRTGTCDGKVRDTIRPLCPKSCQLHQRQHHHHQNHHGPESGGGDLYQPPPSLGLPLDHHGPGISLKSDPFNVGHGANVIARPRASLHVEVAGLLSTSGAGRNPFPQVSPSWVKTGSEGLTADQTDSAIQRVKSLVEQSQQRGTAGRNAEEQTMDINGGGSKTGSWVHSLGSLLSNLGAMKNDTNHIPFSWLRSRPPNDSRFQGNVARLSTTTSDPGKPGASFGAENSPMAASNMMALSPEFLPESSLASAPRGPQSPADQASSAHADHKAIHRSSARQASPEDLAASLLSLVIEASRSSARVPLDSAIAKPPAASGGGHAYPRLHPTDRMGPDTHANLQP